MPHPTPGAISLNFAQARKDAGRIGNFLKPLAKAQEVFVAVVAAEVKLVHLGEEIKEIERRLKDALSNAVQAEASSQERVEAAEASRIASEMSLGNFQLGIAADRRVLEEAEKQDLFVYDEFAAKLATQRKSAEEAHATRINELRGKEVAALKRVDVAKQKRMDLLNELKMGD